ncbi:MAG: LysM peptidoglycan-binding domain-containing protein [Chthoniobacteraceae bacterium]
MNRALVLVVAGLLLAGCDRRDLSREASDLGDKRAKVGAYREAVRAYESAFDGTARTADVHYKIASIFDEKLKVPLSAIHHYDRYLELAPSGVHAKDAKVSREDCHKRLALSMVQGGIMTTGEAKRLKNENEALRRRLAEASSLKPAPVPRVANPEKPDPIAPGSKTHLVAKGDTLASIALKHYGNRAYSSHIKDANFNQLGGKDVIKPGMTLIIPERPSRKR